MTREIGIRADKERKRLERKGEKNEEDKRMSEINLSEMFPKQVVLFSTNEFEGRNNIFKLVHDYLKITESEGKKLIWVTTDQPANKLPQISTEYSYSIENFVDRILFVDLVSRGAGIKQSKDQLNISYIENPNNMTDIAMTLADLFNDKMVGLAVIDSINGLLAFNQKDDVIKFIRFLPAIARETETTILLTYESKEHPSELETAIRICTDATFKVYEKTLTLHTRRGLEKVRL